MKVRASRFAVVDDNKEHADLVRDAIARLGRLCQAFYYTPEWESDDELHGVRVLFLDLHLLDSGVNSDKKKDYAVLADLLINGITENGGPFIVILWTMDPQYHNDLQEFLDERLADYKYARPAKVLCLSKQAFFGEGLTDSMCTTLSEAIEATLKQVPQIAALLAWEDDVHRAATLTLSELLSLVSSKGKSTDEYNEDLDLLISRLSAEAVGHKNVSGDPRGALTTALTPILFDQMHYLLPVQSDEWLWREAITKSTELSKKPVTVEEAGKINAMLHIAYAPPSIAATDMGAVVDLPADLMDVNAFELRFGLKQASARNSEYFVEGDKDRAKCFWRLIRIGAACDQAQPKSSPISYLLALEVPVEIARKSSGAGKTRPAEWVSPVFETQDQKLHFNLVANSRFVVTYTRTQVESWNVLYRLREQLLTQLVGHVMQYNARPGIVSLQVPVEVLKGGSGAVIAVANVETHGPSMNVEKKP